MEEQEKIEEPEIEVVNVENELLKQNSKIIFEYKKTIEDLDYSKIKEYIVKDGNITIGLLFYENDFFAINRINFQDGYKYMKSREYINISENINYMIRKIPNVAKARSILKIDNIETRIYDMSEYILLLDKEDKRVLKVINGTELKDIEFSEIELDIEKIRVEVDKYEIEEYARLNEERSLKNKIKIFKEKVKQLIIEPIKLIKQKLGNIQEVKLLSDGRSSIFDKSNK